MKKPKEYTKIKKDTIVGVLVFMVLAVIITVLIEALFLLSTGNIKLPRTDGIYLVFDLSIMAIIVLVTTVVTFIIITETIGIPKVEGKYKIPNPLNKTHFVMNKQTKRPDVTYYRRRPQEWFGWIKIPAFVSKKLEKMAILLVMVGFFVLFVIQSYVGSGWFRTFVIEPSSIVVTILVVYFIFLAVVGSIWTTRKPIVSEDELEEMLPHLEKSDNLLLYFDADYCEEWYRKSFWVVSQDEYDEIVESLD